jgi:hypothetical protein
MMNEAISNQVEISLGPDGEFNLQNNISTLKRLWGVET